MSKVLLFLLIFASFSCATLDSNVKENSKIENNEKVEGPKKESSVEATIPDKPIVVEDSQEIEKSKESVNPTKNSPAIPNEQKDEDEKIVPISSSERETKDDVKKQGEEKEESKKEEKADKEEVSKESTTKNPEKQVVLSTNKSNEVKIEEPKNLLENEKALQDYIDLFPSSTKVEIKTEEKKEEKVATILSSLEILKELEEALNSFQKITASVGTRQRVEKKEKDAKVELPLEKTSEESSTPEIAKKDEKTSTNDVPDVLAEEFNDSGISTLNNDEIPSFNYDDENMLIFDDDSNLRFDDDEEHAFTFDEEEVPFSFDDEKNDEKLKNSELAKNEITDDRRVSDNKGQLSSIVDEEDKVNISRYTNILKGQNIDFSYPGEGWVYLGEETSQKGLTYVKRKMEDGKTLFKFMAENEGNYVLNFSYFDVFSGDFIVDAVSVKVMPNNDGIQKDSLVLEYQGKNEKKEMQVEAKKTPNEVNVDADKVAINTESVEKKEETLPTKGNTVIVNDREKLKPAIPSREENSYKEPEVFTNIASISPENAKTKIQGEDAKKIIDEVSKEISNGNAKKALERLDDFFATASTNMDEAYFLRGKAYELNTELKNIKMALAAYKFLTKTFPNSPFWNEADARIRYIEKFFVKIK